MNDPLVGNSFLGLFFLLLFRQAYRQICCVRSYPNAHQCWNQGRGNCSPVSRPVHLPTWGQSGSLDTDDHDFYADMWWFLCRYVPLTKGIFVIDNQPVICRNLLEYCLPTSNFYFTSYLSSCRISSTMWQIFRTTVWWRYQMLKVMMPGKSTLKRHLRRLWMSLPCVME